MSKVLVTGATGNVGREVMAQLLNEGIAVRALVRDPASATLPAGVEIAQGDLAHPPTLVKHAEEIEAVFLIWPGLPTSLAPAILEAFKPHGSRVVYLSSMSVPNDPTLKIDPITDFHAEMERQIERSGLNWTFLRISGLATNTLGWAQQIRSDGIVRWPFAAAARSLIHEKDVASVAVRALTSAQHHGAKYDLTGPQVLTQAEQVHAIGEAIGRPLRFEETSPEVARQQMRAYFPPATVDGMIEAWGSLVEHPERKTNTVEEVTGTPARTYGEWARDHVRDFS